MTTKLSERYWLRLVAARACWRICESWAETVSVPLSESSYARANVFRAHLLCLRTERLFMRACAAEERRAARLANFSDFQQHRMPLP